MGLSLGPVLGGVLTHNLGWRSIFVLTTILGLIIVAVVFKKLDGEWAAARGEKFDVRGSLIYGFGIVSLIYGLFLLPEVLGVVLVVVGGLGILAFVRWETGIDNPILNIDLFRNNRVFAFSNLAVLINYGATYAVTFLMSLYLQYIKGFSPQIAGLVLVATPVVQAIFSPLAGRMSDRMEPRRIAAVGMAITTGSLCAFIFLDEGTSLAFIIAVLAVLGFGLGLFSSPNTNAVMSSVTQKVYGVASATQATMRHMGMMFSMGIVMLLFVIIMGRVEVTPEYYGLFVKSTSVSFIIFTILCFGGIFAQLAGNKKKK
jgi:MFS family permease